MFKMYENLLLPVLIRKRTTNVLTAFALGMNMFLMYFVMAGLFWGGA